MIGPNSKVSWIDVKTGDHHDGTITELFRDYAERIVMAGEHDAYIVFRAGEIKIKDWYGWTDLVMIHENSNALDLMWHQLHVDNDTLYITGNTFIPIYDPNKDRAGFHGQQLQEYVLYYLCCIPHDTAWVRKRFTSTGEDLVLAHEEFLIPTPDELKTGYDIITASSFVNANNIYIYASDGIDIKDVAKWN